MSLDKGSVSVAEQEALLDKGDLRWAIGLDLGGSALKVGLVASDGSISEFRRTPIDRMAGPQYLLDSMQAEIDRYTAMAKDTTDEMMTAYKLIGDNSSVKTAAGRWRRPSIRVWCATPPWMTSKS